MSPEKRIAQLEAELAEERAERRRLMSILHEMLATQAAKERADLDAKSLRRERNRRSRPVVVSARDRETSHETRTETSHSLPPPLEGSPPLPAPISPSPISSPPSLFSAGSPSDPTGAAAVQAAPAKRQPSKSNALGEFIDWAKAETRKHLAPDAPDNCRLEKHQASRLGEAVKDHGLATVKAAFGLWMGWEGSRAAGYPLGMFAAKWEGWVGRVKAPAGSNFGTAKPENKPNTPNILELEARWKAARQ